MRRKSDLDEPHRIELLLFDQTGDSSSFENLTRMSNDVHPSDEILAQRHSNASEAEPSSEAFGRRVWTDRGPEFFPRSEPKDLNEPC